MAVRDRLFFAVSGTYIHFPVSDVFSGNNEFTALSRLTRSLDVVQRVIWQLPSAIEEEEERRVEESEETSESAVGKIYDDSLSEGVRRSDSDEDREDLCQEAIDNPDEDSVAEDNPDEVDPDDSCRQSQRVNHSEVDAETCADQLPSVLRQLHSMA
jgi:hypothetical protein